MRQWGIGKRGLVFVKDLCKHCGKEVEMDELTGCLIHKESDKMPCDPNSEFSTYAKPRRRSG